MAESGAWLLVLSAVFLCNALKILLPSCSSLVSHGVEGEAGGWLIFFSLTVKARTAQLAKIKWVINIVFYILQAALMISLIWKYYSEPVTVLPSKWLAPLERLVAFPTGVAGGVGITCWLVVCNKVVAIMLHPFS
ncbi:guided entry of tail-anchored proteins factor 1 [Pyrgilauda ruficollis]|uniref:guided entry of tail-anchored proteins factor 1 n=1 Tax=Pyrgilauda ruficollis TaxID=221976 RepID=UPI001B8602B3|nr:guided entry of tail-anchored proteins factor 1 [Pyrgilauda ruficollis]